MEFVALDVETANADMASVCQIGLAHFSDGVVAGSWKTYVDPEDNFDPINVSIHGITEETVRGAPTFPTVGERLCRELADTVVVCHTHFDRVAISQCFLRHKLETPEWVWLDSARVARRAWKQFAWRGYGLENLCQSLGYQYSAHDALEDAKAAGFVLLSAMKESGLDVLAWLDRVQRPIAFDRDSLDSAREVNADGPLHGEVIVFTGALTISRGQAADLAAKSGCAVAGSVTKKTTMLVVGDQDVTKLAVHEKSTKHRKAEALIMEGQAIRILKETDFRELVRRET